MANRSEHNQRRWMAAFLFSAFLFFSLGCSSLAKILPAEAATSMANILPADATTPLPTPKEIEPGWKPLIVDTFDQSSAIFPDEPLDSENSTLVVSTENGASVWKFTAKQDHAGIGLNVSENENIGDFYLALDVRQTRCPGTCEYGLLFRAAESDMYTFFIREQEGTFDFLFSTPTLTRMADFNTQTASSAIRAGDWNRIAVMAVGSRISLWINEDRVSQIDDSSSQSGMIAFMVTVDGAGAEAEFQLDNLQLYGP